MQLLLKEDILANLNNPPQLEVLYRANKSQFKQEFNLLKPDIEASKVIECWDARLNYTQPITLWKNNNEWIAVIILSAIAGVMAKLPQIFSLKADDFYMKNIGFLAFLPLVAYFFIKGKASLKTIVPIVISALICVIFMNLLPDNNSSDTIILASIHIPLIVWFFWGYSFTGTGEMNYNKRLHFLRFNGDLLVMTAIILIAGFILSGITINLFSFIGFKIEEFYSQHIVVYGLAAVPLVGTYILENNPQLVNKVAPVIAKLFTPLVLVMLIIYLPAILISGKDPFNDREFLLLFNGLLIGVMALILFSVAEMSVPKANKWQTLVLLLLSTLTILINGIALSAIMFRISTLGFTPNRLAVFGGNLLLLVHLFLVSFQLLKTFRQKGSIDAVGKVIASFLPIYCLWAAIVTFIFPFLFSFK